MKLYTLEFEEDNRIAYYIYKTKEEAIKELADWAADKQFIENDRILEIELEELFLHALSTQEGLNGKEVCSRKAKDGTYGL